MVKLYNHDRLVSFLCMCSMVLYFAGCSTPSLLKSVADPNYQPTYNDGLLIGSALWGGEAAYGLIGGYLVGDFLYHSLSGASSSSDGSMQFLDGYPRQVEAQYLVRLDGNRQVIGDMNSTEWVGALYYAIRPEARNVRDSNFDSSTYAVDLDAGTVAILDTAYEEEPFTGTVIVKPPSSEYYRLFAYINRGIMVENGSKWDANGTERLRNQYDETGLLLESRIFDENGTLTRTGIYDENGTLSEYHNYDENGTIRLTSLYDENGRVREDHAYYDNGIVSQRRIYGEDGSIETRQIFNKKGKRDIYKEGSIFVSDVQIKIVRLNLHSNPTQDSVPLIYDRHELATQEFPFAFTGKVFEFYDGKRTHQKREESINNGVYHGPSTWWHKNGTKQFEAEFVKGVLQGRTVWYREDGSVEYEGFWKNGELDEATTYDINHDPIGDGVISGNGTLTYQHPNGEKRLEETYTDGKLTETKWWDEQGNPVESVEPKFIPIFGRMK